jgi:acetoin utilization protein AcuC
MATAYTGGRALYTLGGGYNLDATVRSWALLVQILQDRPLPNELPEAWRTRWAPKCPGGIAPALHDAANAPPNGSDPEAMRTANRATVRKVLASL